MTWVGSSLPRKQLRVDGGRPGQNYDRHASARREQKKSSPIVWGKTRIKCCSLACTSSWPKAAASGTPLSLSFLLSFFSFCGCCLYLQYKIRARLHLYVLDTIPYSGDCAKAPADKPVTNEAEGKIKVRAQQSRKRSETRKRSGGNPSTTSS